MMHDRNALLQGATKERRNSTLLCMGRLTVDLYGEQEATSLRRARSFRRYAGGSSGNLAIGAARLGVSTGLITTVGADPMGDYLMDVLAREGVNDELIHREPDRRTALAFLGMLDAEAINLDFYREAAADEVIHDHHVPQAALDECRTFAVTGTLAAAISVDGAVRKIMDRVVTSNAQLVVDIDFRKTIWENAPGGMDGAVDRVWRLLEAASLVVGNEDEFRVMAQADRLEDALKTMRNRVSAPLILKLGGNGAMWIDADSPDSFDEIPIVPGYPVNVLNPVGAGDAFLAGFLCSWLEGEAPAVALKRGNACGALVVSRHGCSQASPYRREVDQFMADQNTSRAARLHRILGRPDRKTPVYALACDHRDPFDKLMEEAGRPESDARHFKSLAATAVERTLSTFTDATPGMLLDSRFGQQEMGRGEMQGWWIGRPVELTHSRPLAFEPGSLEGLCKWPPDQVAKCLVWHHPDDAIPLRDAQFAQLHRLQAACQANDIEWMLEIVPPLDLDRDNVTLLRSMDQVYDAGLHPDWWKLPGFDDDAGWKEARKLLERRDPYCRGIFMLGLNEPYASLRETVIRAGRNEVCVGFAIGRTIFGDVSRQWFPGELTDEQAITSMQIIYQRIVADFESGRAETLG